MTLPAAQTRRAVLEEVVKDLEEPVRGAAATSEIALARLAAPLARVASAVAHAALRHDGDRDAQEEVLSHLRCAVEEVATAVIAFFAAGTAGGAEGFDADKVEALIEKPARGFPVWHEQPSLLETLEIWTTDLYQDLNNGVAVYGKPKWNGIDDLVRTVRDCIELSAWLSEQPLPPYPEDAE